MVGIRHFSHKTIYFQQANAISANTLVIKASAGDVHANVNVTLSVEDANVTFIFAGGKDVDDL